MERDLEQRSDNKSKNDFNSHAHVERDEDKDDTEDDKRDFNSHAHVERDLRKLLKMLDVMISTHTLTWSVTRLFSLSSR